MAIVSYGTITITDTNDIERIYTVYAKSTTNTTAPSAAASSWTESISTAPGSGDYIWQRTVVKKSGTGELTYSNPVCVTGPEGNVGKGVKSVITQYYLSTSSSSVTGGSWNTTPQTYPASGTKYYWTKTITTYTDNTTYESTAVYNVALTNSVKDARDANTTANSANTKADNAVSTANSANTTATNAYNIATGINQHFWTIATDYAEGLPAGSYITDTAIDTFKSQKTGGNLLTRSDGIWIRNGVKTLTSLTGSALTFYNPSTNTAQLVIGANGTLQSGNYSRGSDSKFSSNGTKIDLINGDIITKYFRLSQGLESLNAGAYIHGTIEALDGSIGSDTTNYWEIGNGTDYNLNSTAKIIGHGSSYIQLGDSSTWRLATNRIHTGWYISSDSLLHFPSINSKYWDFGIHSPSSATDKFLYIRSSKANTSASNVLKNLLYDIDDSYATSQWDYKFYIDGEGNLYAKNLYFFDENGNPVQVGGADGAYLPKTGGTITGNLEVNGTLTKGSKNVAYLTATPTNGQILIADGTAGGIKTSGYTIATSVPSGALFTDKNVQTSQANTTKIYLAGTPTTGTATGVLNYDSNVYLTTTAGTLHATTFDGTTFTGMAAKATNDSDGNKISTTYLKLSGGTVSGEVEFGSAVSINDEFYADSITAGNLIVNGTGRFTNGLYGDLTGNVTGSITGNAATADKVNKDLKIQLNGGTTEGTNQFTFNGSAAKTVNITKSSIGLGNVDNTADANKNVLTATKFNSNRTIALTGDVTGSTSGDGSSGWSIATTVQDDSHYHTMAYAKKPIQSKTYESTSYYATSSGSWETSSWYFMSVKPDAWYKPWSIRFRVHSYCPSYSSVDSITDSYITGRADSVSYSNYTERYDAAHYYIPVYLLRKAGFDAGLGHAIGISILYGTSYTNSAYYRTFEVDFLECENCTVTFLDTPIKWANWTNGNTTNYNSIGSLDATTRGYTQTGDRNDTTTISSYYDRITAGENGLKQYSLAMRDSNGTWQSFTTDYGVGTTKTRNTVGFIPGDLIYLGTGSNYAADNIVGWGAVRHYQSLIDYRYSFNCGTTLTANTMVYIVGTIGTDGLFYLDSNWYTQTLPTTEDNKIYIPLGIPYPDSGPYRGDFSGWHAPVWFKNGKVVPYGGDAATVNGKTPLFSHQDISGKADKSATVSNVAYDSTNKKITKTINGTTSDVVTVATLKTALNLAKADVGLSNVTNDAQIPKSVFTAANQIIYSTAANAPTVLAPNTTSTKKFLRMTGTGSAGAAPAWDTVTKTDVGLGNVLDYAQITNITNQTDSQGHNTGKLLIWKGATSSVLEVEITATESSTATTAQKAINDADNDPIKSNYAHSISISGHTITLKDKSGNALGDSITVPDNNTTYTFANGTNGFTVTPSGGTAQTVTVTPSIANNITGSGTSGYLAKFNGANTITSGPALGTDTTKFLNNKGEWAVPGGTYSLPLAANGTRGGVQIGFTTNAANRNYAVQLSSEKMYVNVPWTDTTYSAGTGLSLTGTTFANTGVTGVKGNSESSYRTGQVNLTPANLGAVATTGDEIVAGKKTFSDILQVNKTIRDGTGQHYYGGAANRSQWYKITLAHNGITPPSTAQWYMCSMTIHIAGDYNSCPRGTIELCYYIYWNGSVYRADNVYATGYGPLINKAKIYYNLTDPFILYVDTFNQYTSIWVDYVSYRDSAQSHNTKETKVERTSAITVTDYTVIPTSYMYTVEGSSFYVTNHLYPNVNNSFNLGASSYKWANVYATTFHGDLSGKADTASKITDLTSNDNASYSADWRKVWISYANGTTGRPAVTTSLAYQTSTSTLKTPHFLSEHADGGQNEFRVTYGSTVDMAMMIGNANENHGLYDNKAAKWMIVSDINGNVTVNGNATNVTGTVTIDHGGTGATTAATARANLGTWSLVSDSYNTLMPANGTSNGWVKIGTSNTSFGILPSASGGPGAGHNYIGTSSWYWKYAYIDQIYGYLNGDISGNAATATKATQDGSGNTITSKYVTLDTVQNITANKIFSNGIKFTTETNTTTPSKYGAVHYDSTLEALVFSFA